MRYCVSAIHFSIIIPESEWKLLLIRKQSQVGSLPGGLPIFRIDKIAILPLNIDATKDLDIDVSMPRLVFIVSLCH